MEVFIITLTLFLPLFVPIILLMGKEEEPSKKAQEEPKPTPSRWHKPTEKPKDSGYYYVEYFTKDNPKKVDIMLGYYSYSFGWLRTDSNKVMLSWKPIHT